MSASSSSARSRRASCAGRRPAPANPLGPLDSIGPRKQRQVRAIAREWLVRAARGPAAARDPLRRDRHQLRPPRAAARARAPRGRVLRPAPCLTRATRSPRRRGRSGASPRAPAACRRSRRTTSGAAARSRSRDRGAVLGRRVADVRLEVPARVALGGAAHEAVARTLASTDAPAIAALCESPPTTARCSTPNSGTRKPSTRHIAPGGATRISACAARRGSSCAGRARRCRARSARRSPPRGRAHDERVELLAASPRCAASSR